MSSFDLLGDGPARASVIILRLLSVGVADLELLLLKVKLKL